jgi:hypothetical protein
MRCKTCNHILKNCHCASKIDSKEFSYSTLTLPLVSGLTSLTGEYMDDQQQMWEVTVRKLPSRGEIEEDPDIECGW